MVGDAVTVVSHNVVSNAFKLVAGLAFLPVMSTIARHDARALVSWPNGGHRHLSVNTAPFEDGVGRVGGAVAAFVEREPATGSVR